MNIEAYLKRIDWTGPARADFETLNRLHQQHATRIPFENLDIQLGKPILLDLPSLERKMIQDRRGGYCFEQNTLFQNVLNEIGFNVIACEARVRMGRAIISPRTHMMLIVTLPEGRFLADVGFGGDGLLLPVSVDGSVCDQFLWKYRVVKEEGALLLQTLKKQNWFDLYTFAPEPRYPPDFEVANWYTSTHPESRFVLTLTAQRPTPEARYILRNKLLVIENGKEEISRELQSNEELLTVLDQMFDLKFPENTSFRAMQFAGSPKI